MTAGVAATQRFTASHPCPICGGHRRLPQGQGTRCYGFLSSDGLYAHCTREELAGDLDAEEESNTYAHLLEGDCRCGETHGASQTRATNGHANGKGVVVGGKTTEQWRKEYRTKGTRRVVRKEAHKLRDEDGTVVAVHKRKYFDDGDKEPWWERPDGTKDLGGAKVVDLPFYGIHECTKAKMVIVTEGEPARDALASIGARALGTVTGAKSTPNLDRWRRLLKVKTVYLWPDNDDDGEAHLRKNLTQLRAVGHPDVRVIDWPDAPHKGDAADFVEAGGTLDDLLALMEQARPASEYAESPNAESPIERSAFPLDGLPKAIKDYVREAADAIGCPVEFVALPLLCGVGAAIGNRVVFAIKSGLTAPAILFAAGIGHPGTGKTPAAEAALIGLRKRQDVYADNYQNLLDRYEALPKKERDGSKPPVMDRVMVSDVTIEALAKDLARSRGILSYPGELTGWLHALSRYKQNGGSDRPAWLQLWSGQAIDQSRLSRGPTYAKKPHVCLYGEIQPDRIKLITKEAGNDGLLDRFLVSWPDADPLAVSEQPMPDPQPIVDLVDGLIRIDLAPSGGAWLVRPSREAFDRYREWHDDENLQAIMDGTGAGRGWAAKAPQHVQRLALIFHLLNDPTGGASADLSAETMDDAIALVEYFRGQQAQLVAMLNAGVVATPKTIPLADRVLRLLRRKARWLSTQELTKGIRNATMDQLSPVLADLIEAGHAEQRDVETATKPRREWRATSMFADSPKDHSANSANSENPCNGAENGTAEGFAEGEFAESRDSANSIRRTASEGENLASDQGESGNAEFAERPNADSSDADDPGVRV